MNDDVVVVDDDNGNRNSKQAQTQKKKKKKKQNFCALLFQLRSARDFKQKQKIQPSNRPNSNRRSSDGNDDKKKINTQINR